MSSNEDGHSPTLVNTCGRWWCAYETHLDAGADSGLTRHHLTLGHVREATDDVVVTLDLVGVDTEPPTLLLTRTPLTTEAAASLSASGRPPDPAESTPPQWVARLDPFEAIRLVTFLLDGIDRVADEPSQSTTFQSGGTPFPRTPEMTPVLGRFPAAASAEELVASLRASGVDPSVNDVDAAQQLAAQPLVFSTVTGWLADLRR